MRSRIDPTAATAITTSVTRRAVLLQDGKTATIRPIPGKAPLPDARRSSFVTEPLAERPPRREVRTVALYARAPLNLSSARLHSGRTRFVRARQYLASIASALSAGASAGTVAA